MKKIVVWLFMAVVIVAFWGVQVKAAEGSWKTYYDFTDIYDFENRIVNENVDFRDKGQCGQNVYWYITYDYRLIITGQGAMDDYVWEPMYTVGTNANKAPWYTYATYVKEVYIEEGVTTIGSGAFLDFTMCRFIHIPNSVTRIGYIAFENCKLLKHLRISADLSEIYAGAFANSTFPLCYEGSAEEFESIGKPQYVGGNGWTSQWNDAYTGSVYYHSYNEEQDGVIKCSACNHILKGNEQEAYLYSGTCGENANWGITEDYKLVISGLGDMTDYVDGPSYTLGNDNKAPWYGFANQIKAVEVREGITSIGSEAFLNFTVCESVSIPETVTKIGYIAFENCFLLKHIRLPHSVKEIYAGAFCNDTCSVCYVGTEEEFNNIDKVIHNGYGQSDWTLGYEGQVYYDSRDIVNNGITVCSSCNVVLDLNGNQYDNVAQGKCGQDLEWVITNDYCLRIYGTGRMTDYVNAPYYTVGVNSKAPWFPYAGLIRYIIIEDGVESIGNGAFLDFSVCENVEVPDSVISIGYIAFENCYRLHHLSLSDRVTEIKAGAFWNDTFPICYRGAEEAFESISKPAYQGYEEVFWNTGYTGNVNYNSGREYTDFGEYCSSCHTCLEGWEKTDTKKYWYERNVKQGTYEDPKNIEGDGTIRGREIYDPRSNGWHWLDACYEGADAYDKEVWMPYIYSLEDQFSEEEIINNAAASGEMADQVKESIYNKTGKWVRYDSEGRMYKGWYTVEGADAELYPTQAGNTYYYDPKTGLMARGYVYIDGVQYHFDEITGVLTK